MMMMMMMMINKYGTRKPTGWPEKLSHYSREELFAK